MKKFIVYNQQGKILRIGTCQDRDFTLQANQDELVMEGEANDFSQKIIDGKVVNKTPEEIDRDNPMPLEKKPVIITNEQWQGILDRIRKLEETNHV